MQCSMQHIPFHSALLAKNTIFDPKKHFFPQSTPEKVRKSQQILKMWRNSICLGWNFLSESKLFGEGHWRFLAILNFCHPAMRIFLPQYVTIRFYIINPISPGGGHIVRPLLRICLYLCNYAYELVEKTWLFSVMSLEKGSTLFTP